MVSTIFFSASLTQFQGIIYISQNLTNFIHPFTAASNQKLWVVKSITKQKIDPTTQHTTKKPDEHIVQ